ncbi:MAG: ABC transporter permease [Propionibacterium sp.]|nr:ABC transporter permease [Propionibacterium sp.]
MSLDFTPRPEAAPRGRQVWIHGKMEAGLILRNGEQLILAIIFPMMVLVGGRYIGDRLSLGFQELAPSVLGMVMWSSGLTTLAIATGFERRYNVLERLAATPLGRDGILLGKALSIAMITFAQIVIFAVAGLILGWRPQFDPLALLVAIVVVVLSMGAFIGLGLALAGSLKPEQTLAIANMLYLAGLPLGIIVPLSLFPGWAQIPLSLLPTAALGETLRAASAGEVLWLPLLVSAAWCVFAAWLARKVFQWMS